NKRMVFYAKLSIIGVLIVSFFSYPFQSFAISLCFYVFSALIAANGEGKKYSISLNIRFTVFIIAPYFFFISKGISQIGAIRKWRTAHYMMDTNEVEAFRIYNEIYPSLQHEGRFLFNYGAH